MHFSITVYKGGLTNSENSKSWIDQLFIRCSYLQNEICEISLVKHLFNFQASQRCLCAIFVGNSKAHLKLRVKKV